MAKPSATGKGAPQPPLRQGEKKQAPKPRNTTNSGGHNKKEAKADRAEMGKGTRQSPPSLEGGRVPDPSLFLERIAPLPIVATGAPKKGGRHSSLGPLPRTSKPLTCSRQSVTIARHCSTSCRSTIVAKRGCSNAWPVRSVLPGRKGRLRILCAKSGSTPPTPPPTTPVVISDAPVVRSIRGPANALAITIHPHNGEDVPSAKTLALPPTSTTEDRTLAEVVDVQAGLDRALVPYTGPPEAEGSASALAIMDGSAKQLDLPPTSSAADPTLAEMADARLVPPLPESDSEDDLRGNNVVDVPLGESQTLEVFMTGVSTPVNPGTPTPEIQSFSDSGSERMEIASFSPSQDGAVIPPAPTAVVAQVANVVASDHISQFTASEEGLVVVHTASRVVEQTTIMATQQE